MRARVRSVRIDPLTTGGIRSAGTHVFVQVVALVVEFRMKLLNVEGDCQRRIPERGCQLVADHLEHPLTDFLAHLQRTAVPDVGGGVDESVIRMAVRDAIMLPALGAKWSGPDFNSGADAPLGRSAGTAQSPGMRLKSKNGSVSPSSMASWTWR